jgi:uncharacterized lipoprotein YajG
MDRLIAMRLFLVVLSLALAGCTAPEHPLTYVNPSDPVWSINPEPALGSVPAQSQRQASVP